MEMAKLKQLLEVRGIPTYYNKFIKWIYVYIYIYNYIYIIYIYIYIRDGNYMLLSFVSSEAMM